MTGSRASHRRLRTLEDVREKLALLVVRAARALVMLGASTGMLLAAGTYLGGASEVVGFVHDIIEQGWGEHSVTRLLSTLDVLLVGTTVLIVSVGLWDLFVGGLPPKVWPHVENLSELKLRVIEVLVLVLGVKFLETYTRELPPSVLVAKAGSAVLVGLLLIVFAWFKQDDRPKRRPPRDN